LGTHNLPKLFMAGLVAMLVVAPAASAHLSGAGAKHRQAAVQRLLYFMACVLLGEGHAWQPCRTTADAHGSRHADR
jgi:hypothetical protein